VKFAVNVKWSATTEIGHEKSLANTGLFFILFTPSQTNRFASGRIFPHQSAKHFTLNFTSNPPKISTLKTPRETKKRPENFGTLPFVLCEIAAR
jgi:hypothetical protein